MTEQRSNHEKTKKFDKQLYTPPIKQSKKHRKRNPQISLSSKNNPPKKSLFTKKRLNKTVSDNKIYISN